MQRHKSQCSRENVALSSGALFDIVRLSLGISALIPPLPVPLSELLCGRNGKE